MDLTTIGGLALAIAGILGGQLLEGGHVGSILQGTAALIILGGTFGAVMVAFPKKDFARGLKMMGQAFTEKKQDLSGVTKQIVELASVARRDGVLALEGKLPEIEDKFLKKALTYVVDGVDASVTRSSLEAAIETEHQEHTQGAKVWEAAGGFAPTIGILGAVLGLIHVMENLSDPSKLGGGIATAFVATVYGVGSANLVFLPVATKLKRKLALAMERKVIITEGVLAIQEGLNPRVLEEKLRALTGEEAPPKEQEKKAA
ncbi:MAG TPA: flagellar motor protein [Anaeromyxobacteraceae bacterium]|nr:flagellar motor protein [Anaeromyxobacteraceae bacterium]